jgi:hypothetical protein
MIIFQLKRFDFLVLKFDRRNNQYSTSAPGDKVSWQATSKLHHCAAKFTKPDGLDGLQ